jgi:hypothetical protein
MCESRGLELGSMENQERVPAVSIRECHLKAFTLYAWFSLLCHAHSTPCPGLMYTGMGPSPSGRHTHVVPLVSMRTSLLSPKHLLTPWPPFFLSALH